MIMPSFLGDVVLDCTNDMTINDVVNNNMAINKPNEPPFLTKKY